jgi:hypothetical protein
MGGDINFSLGAHEFWGQTTHLDPLVYFFLSQLEEVDFVDIQLAKILPT